MIIVLLFVLMFVLMALGLPIALSIGLPAICLIVSPGVFPDTVTLSALGEPSGAAAWKRLPSYVIYGSADRNIPAAVMAFMAERAHAQKTVVLEGASHALMVSHPDEVATFIEDAARAQ